MTMKDIIRGPVLKILQDNHPIPMTVNMIVNRLNEATDENIHWVTVHKSLTQLRKDGRVEEMLSGKLRLYKVRG